MKYVDIDPGMTIDEIEAAANEIVESNKGQFDPEDDFIISRKVLNGPLPQYASPFSSVLPTVVINVWPLELAIPPERYLDSRTKCNPSQHSVKARLMAPKVKGRSRWY